MWSFALRPSLRRGNASNDVQPLCCISCYFAPVVRAGRDAKYCDEYIRLFVCVCLSARIARKPLGRTISPIFGRPYHRSSLWYTMSSVCRLSVCDVLYCGETVRPSEKVSEGVNRKPGSKSWFFWVAAIFLLPVLPLWPQRRPFLPYFCWYSPAIGTRW